jgi:hypothetical protein
MRDDFAFANVKADVVQCDHARESLGDSAHGKEKRDWHSGSGQMSGETFICSFPLPSTGRGIEGEG